MAVHLRQFNQVFLLAPGTGSTVVAETLVDFGLGEWLPKEDLRLGENADQLVPAKHTTYEHFKRWPLLNVPVEDCEFVTTVRNPFDFWVSEYTRHRTRWSTSLGHMDSHIYAKPDEADRVQKSTELDFGDWLEYRWSSFGPDHQQFLHPQFTRFAERVLRFEKLEECFKEWLLDIDIGAPLILPVMNTTKRDRDYRKYYDAKSRGLVERIFAPYLERFEYSF